MNLAESVSDFFRRHQLERTSGVVAVSGGPDSVALAHLLIDLQREGKLQRLIVAHVNHQLRGAESDGDEAFVQSHFEGNCRTTRIDVAAIALAERSNLESIARRERYAWLERVACAEGAAWIATGHTADDQAETVLFRLLRGAGVRGLGGMAESRSLESKGFLVRPLLQMRRQALLAFLHDRQIAYRIDSSNRDLRFTRNRLRLELLPTLEQTYNPAIVDVLCRLGEQAREIHDEVSSQAAILLAEAELPRAGEVLVFSAERLGRCAANDIREMFRLVWRREKWPLSEMNFACWNRLAEIALGTLNAWDFPGKIKARRFGRVVQVQAR